jgi:hypothetical protein
MDRNGFQEAAFQRGCNLLCTWGVHRRSYIIDDIEGVNSSASRHLCEIPKDARLFAPRTLRASDLPDG